jgi:hypothetical protein
MSQFLFDDLHYKHTHTNTHSLACFSSNAQADGVVRLVGDVLKDGARTLQGPFTMFATNKCVAGRGRPYACRDVIDTREL